MSVFHLSLESYHLLGFVVALCMYVGTSFSLFFICRRSTSLLPVSYLSHTTGALLSIFIAAAFGVVVFAFVANYGCMTNSPLIKEVTPYSTAYEAGLRSGDILVALNGKPVVGGIHDLANFIRHDLGTIANIVVKRAGEDVSLALTPDHKKLAYLGISGEELSHNLSFSEKLSEAFSASLSLLISMKNRLLGITAFQTSPVKSTPLTEFARGLLAYCGFMSLLSFLFAPLFYFFDKRRFIKPKRWQKATLRPKTSGISKHWSMREVALAGVAIILSYAAAVLLSTTGLFPHDHPLLGASCFVLCCFVGFVGGGASEDEESANPYSITNPALRSAVLCALCAALLFSLATFVSPISEIAFWLLGGGGVMFLAWFFTLYFEIYIKVGEIGEVRG